MNNQRCDDTAVAMMMMLILLRWLHRRFRHSIMHNAHTLCGRYVNRAFLFLFLSFLFLESCFLFFFYYYSTYGTKWKLLAIFGVMLIEWATSGWYLLMFRSNEANWQLSLRMQLRSTFIAHIQTHEFYASMHMRLLNLIVELMFQDKTNSLLLICSFVHFTINSFSKRFFIQPILIHSELNASKTIYCCIFLHFLSLFIFLFI